MDKKWKTVIGGKEKLINIDFNELWQYKNLILMLFKRNYSLQYKQTILGPLWMIFGVVFNTGIFTVVFGYVGKMQSDGVPYFLFCMTGNVIWNLFATSFRGNTRVLMENAYIFGKVYFPRIIVPLANTLLCLERSMLQFAVCIVVWGITAIRGGIVVDPIRMLGLIPLLAFSAIMGTALGMIICSLTVKYRDFEHLTGIAVSGLMYISPVLYPTSQLSPFIKRFVYFNPMSALVEAFRFCMSETDTLFIPGIIYSVIFTVIIAFVALIMYGNAEKDCIDII